MPIEFKDRVAANPGRVKISPENGAPYYATMERADNPSEAGTPLNAATFNELIESLKSGSVAGTMGSMYGQYKTPDGLLLQWGSATITPVVAGEPVTVTVKFPIAYSTTPAMVVTPVSTVPQNISVSTQRSGDYVSNSRTEMAITLVRDGLTATGVTWFAIGKGVV